MAEKNSHNWLDHKWHYGSCTLANNATTTEVEIQFERTELIATPTRDRRRTTYVGGYEMLIETEEVFAREGDELFAIAEVPHHGDVQLLLDTAVQPIFILNRDPAEISAEYRSRAATAMLAVGICCGLSLIVILAILLI